MTPKRLYLKAPWLLDQSDIEPANKAWDSIVEIPQGRIFGLRIRACLTGPTQDAMIGIRVRSGEITAALVSVIPLRIEPAQSNPRRRREDRHGDPGDEDP